MAISKRLRYEVFRRDNHACRYCGATAPEAKLTVDHVVPVTLGGTDEPGNLVTACVDCNSGKSSATPDTPIVAEISADALRWGRAMQEAAWILLDSHRARTDLHEQFLGVWNNWTYGSSRYAKNMPLDTGWQQSVDNFLAAGLPMELLTECINRAMKAKHVTPENTFRYMCGIAWRKVSELQEITSSLIAQDPDDPGPEDPDELPAEPTCGCGCGQAWTGHAPPHPPPADVKVDLDRIRDRRD